MSPRTKRRSRRSWSRSQSELLLLQLLVVKMPPPSMMEFEADCGEDDEGVHAEGWTVSDEGLVNSGSGSESEYESGSESGPCGGLVSASPAFVGHRRFRFRDAVARAAVCGGFGPLAGVSCRITPAK